MYAVYIGSAARMVRAIVRFADTELRNQLEDRVTLRVVFMFHQTHLKTVKVILRAMRQLPNEPRWRALPFVHVKHLQVTPVVLLSCESGMDKTFQPGPDPPTRREQALRRYALQARAMRVAIGAGLLTPMAPPPGQPPRYYDPEVITFSTGDSDTGGIVLDPFQARFKRLPGRFREDGSWSYDPTPPGQDQDAFRAGEDTAGTAYSDFVHQGSSDSNDVPEGAAMPIIP